MSCVKSCIVIVSAHFKSAEPTQRTAYICYVLLAGMPDSIPGSWLGMVLRLGSTVGGNGPREWPARPSYDFGCSNLLSIVIHLLAQAASTPRDLCKVFRVVLVDWTLPLSSIPTMWWLKIPPASAGVDFLHVHSMKSAARSPCT